MHKIHFRFLPLDDDLPFLINEMTGEIRIAEPLDYEDQDSYTFNVRVTDGQSKRNYCARNTELATRKREPLSIFPKTGIFNSVTSVTRLGDHLNQHAGEIHG